MALEDIVFPETDVQGFIDEIPQGTLGTITDIVFDINQIEELILTGGTGEVSWIF